MIHDPMNRDATSRSATLCALFVCLLTAGCERPLAEERADLPRILERGTLRVLVPSFGEGFLPREGMPAYEERQLARQLAHRLGLEAELIVVEDRSQLVEMLVRGRGDLVAAQLTVTPERRARVAFTRPLAVVSEWLVTAKGTVDPPRSLEELGGWEIHVRPSSAFAETLRTVAERHGLKLEVVPVDEALDTETLVYEVSEGKRPLTVVDSNLLAAIETYNPNVEPLFALAEGRQIAWAVRKSSPRLLAAANEHVIAYGLTSHRRDRFTSDLDEIQKRKAIRFLTVNNAISYFLHRGRQMGFDYELARLAARELDVRLEMIVPPSRDLLVPWLLDGRGDVIAASYTVTEERQELIDFSAPYLFVQELLVEHADAERKVRSLGDLEGRTVHVLASSSHKQTLEALREFAGPFEIVEVDEHLDGKDLIDQVAAGEIELTVADSHLLEAELTYRDDVRAALELEVPVETAAADLGVAPAPREIAFGVRKTNPELKRFLDGFVRRTYRGLEYNVARKRYFEEPRRLPEIEEERFAVSGSLSPYDDLLKKYASRYRLDWRLLSAQAYEESLHDPEARSWAGAVGVFQILPSTARELGFDDVTDDVEAGIHAGVRYMSELIRKPDPAIPLKHRIRFALAAYNAGWGHVQDARRLAAQQGWDADKWFGHTERAIVLLEQPEFYRNARYGYVRGSETVRYVSDIQLRYDHYVDLIPE